MRNLSALILLLLCCGSLTNLSAQDIKNATLKANRATAHPNQQVQAVRTAKVFTGKTDLRSAEEKNNWSAPEGILSSTKKTPQGGRLTASNYAKAGRAAGQTASETLRELRRGFQGVSTGDLLRALMNAGYTWPEAAKALHDLSEQPGTVTALLRKAGAPANDMALIIKKQYALDSESVANVMKAGGYSTADIVKASQEALRVPADVLFKNMRYLRADMTKVIPLVREAYGFTELNTMRVARMGGIAPADLEKVILTTFRSTSADAAELMKAAEVTPQRIVSILRNTYRMNTRQAAKIMKNRLGLPVGEAGRLLKIVYKSSPEDVAEALVDGAKYNYDRAKSALSKLYDMSMSDVVKMLSPWH